VATNLENHGKGKNSSRNLEIMENWTLIMEKLNFLENHGTFFEKPGKSWKTDNSMKINKNGLKCIAIFKIPSSK
jgi:hypothetical protein